MLVVSEKESPQGLLVVVTDKDILGKKFEEERIQLDLTAAFYSGEEMSKEDAKVLVKRARHVHLTGKEAVVLGVEMDLVDSDAILYVEKVPHAEVVVEL